MRKKLYLTGIEQKAGKSFISLGLVSILSEQNQALRCYKLFSESDVKQIPLLESISQQTIMPLMDIHQGINLMRTQPDELLARVLEQVQADTTSTLSYFDGTDFESDNDVVEYQFNLTLAYQLNCDVILVISAKDRTLEHTLSIIKTALTISTHHHANVVGIIINRVPPLLESDAVALMKENLPTLPLITIIPEFEALANPSMHEIAQTLQARILCGETALHRPVRQFTIAAKTVGNFLESRMDRSGMLIITPSDRIDILMGSLLADQSVNYPKIAGIVLTGGEMPGDVICDIMAGLEYPFPVLLSALRTYETATTLYSAKFSLSLDDKPKVNTALSSMRPFLLEPLLHLLAKKSGMTQINPAVFLYDLVHKAKQAKRHIVLPEGDDPRLLEAASYLLTRGIVDITLLGNPDKITLTAKRLGLALPMVQIIDIEQSMEKDVFAERYYALRKHKNINLPIALERMTDPNYFGVMMVYMGLADGMVSGATHTTADTVRPALEIIKTKPGIHKVSSIFIMCLASRVLIYGDCAINPEPDSQTLADIASQAADITARLGIAPKVALLSYSSGDSGKGGSVEKVAAAFSILKKHTRRCR